MKLWMYAALAFVAATADLKVRTTSNAGDGNSGVVQAFRPAVNNTLTAIPGIKVGHHTLAERPHRLHGRVDRSRCDGKRRCARRGAGPRATPIC